MSSLTGKRPSWAGSKRPRKRVDVVGIRKKVEMGETGCKSKHAGGGGGQNQTCFITRAVTGSPHTPRSPTGAQGIAQSTFLTTSKICGIRAKKNTLRRKKLSHLFFFSAEYLFFQHRILFSVQIVFLAKKNTTFLKALSHITTPVLTNLGLKYDNCFGPPRSTLCHIPSSESGAWVVGVPPPAIF